MFSYGQRSKCADLLNSYPTTYKWGSAADSCDSPSLRFSIDTPMPRIAPHCVLPQSSKAFVIRSFFFEKWLLIILYLFKVAVNYIIVVRCTSCISCTLSTAL